MSQGTSLQNLLRLTSDDSRPAEAPQRRGAEPMARPATGMLCACCGQSFLVLKRHLLVDHGLSEAAYRSLHGMPSEVPLMAAGYLARKARAQRG